MALKSFFERWAVVSVGRITSRLNLAGIFSSLFASAGLTYSGAKEGWWLIVLIALVVLIIIIFSMPKLMLHPGNYVNQRLNIDEIDRFIIVVPRVVLIGKEFVGKTTFVNAVATRNERSPQTEKPYVQIAALPDSRPLCYAAFVDTVGQRDHVQYDMASRADVIIYFVDHAEIDGQINIDQDRLRLHRYFFDQLTKSISGGSIIVLFNKHDLWSKCPESVIGMEWLASEIKMLAARSQKFKNIEFVESFSNFTPNAVAHVLRMIHASVRQKNA